MKKSTVLKLLSFLGILAAPRAQTQVVSFHDAFNYPQVPGYAVLFVGQGAYSDPGNNIWNGFGAPNGPGSTWFYGANNPWNATHSPALSNNPGNPYASYGTPTAPSISSGATVWGAGGTIDANGLPTGLSSGNATSAGLFSGITLSVSYGFNNGANGGTTQGQPSWILSRAAVVNGSNPGVGTAANPLGSFTLQNVPAGNYALFLYGANYDNSRGASFSITTGGGTAVGGITSTINANTGGPANTFVLGQTYVEYLGVSPDGSGTISGTWGTVSNPLSGLSGEGDFNGLQLVALVPEPSTAALLLFGFAGFFALRRTRAQA